MLLLILRLISDGLEVVLVKKTNDLKSVLLVELKFKL